MADLDLKPCPFCGGKAKLQRTSIGHSGEYFYECWNIKCEKCGATPLPKDGYTTYFTRNTDDEFIFKGDGKKEAIDKWNRRAYNDAPKLVRCKECRYGYDSGFKKNAVRCKFPPIGGYHPDEFFCAAGRRKEEEQNGE